MIPPAHNAPVTEIVRRVLVETLEAAGKDHSNVTDESHLLSDLGLTSLDFVEVAFSIERELNLRAFPIQDWLIRESTRNESLAFTVKSLVDACEQLVADHDRRGSRVQAPPPFLATRPWAFVLLASMLAAGAWLVLH